MATPSGSVTSAMGFRAAAGTCGIKASGAPDLALIAAEVPCRFAAVFTTNAVKGAPVLVGQSVEQAGVAQAIVCNSGVANVATGRKGINDAHRMCRTVAKAVGCDPAHVLPASTGVIGHRLPIEKINAGILQLADELDRGPAVDAAVARAILTTDLVSKSAVRRLRIGGRTVNIGAVAKGSGMIAPNMATMLCFITTDAVISRAMLRRSLRQAVNADASFNRITVDSDTSTSDTVAILASGLADHSTLKSGEKDTARFTEALTDLCREMAYQIISDGEGATKVIRVVIEGARSGADAERAARSVADSPLVKTAMHGCDPNWGRLAMAVGKSGAAVEMDRLTIRIGSIMVMKSGRPAKFDQTAASRAIDRREVRLQVNLGLGDGRCEILTCDLSRQYITINADYHT